jgi:hypothetical protein
MLQLCKLQSSRNSERLWFSSFRFQSNCRRNSHLGAASGRLLCVLKNHQTTPRTVLSCKGRSEVERELESGERKAGERAMEREEDESALEGEADDSPHVTHQDHVHMALLGNPFLPQSMARNAGGAFRRAEWQQIARGGSVGALVSADRNCLSLGFRV